jgi:hypothetical protein
VPERRSGEDPGLPADVQGSSLRLANALYPDADALRPARVVCVCGTACATDDANVGQRLGQALAGRAPLRKAVDDLFASVSYEAACGRPDAEGDGVTPVEVAMLPGARHVLLPGVWHSPGRGRRWYGTEDVVGLWTPYLAGDAAVAAAARR